MILPEFFLLATVWDFIWGALAVLVVFVTLLLITVILIQDSKDAGLASAFGGGTSGALMGARMQKGLARLTTILAIIFGVSVLVMGKIDNDQRRNSTAAQGDSPTELRPTLDGESGTDSTPPAIPPLPISTPPDAAAPAGTPTPDTGTAPAADEADDGLAPTSGSGQ